MGDDGYESPPEVPGEDGAVGRRNFLLIGTGSVGACVAGLVATPFAASLRPSLRTEIAGAPVKIGTEGLKPGELRRTSWRKKPVWVFGRDAEMLEQSATEEEALSDPDSESSLQPSYCKNKNRSIKPEIFVAIGLCTHLGCTPAQSENKKEGFLCACHGSRFDIAGRVVSGSPAPKNLIVPPHRYDEDGKTLIVGEDMAAS